VWDLAKAFCTDVSFICSTSTILGTNGLNSADVQLSNKQTNKLNRLSRFPPPQFAQIDLSVLTAIKQPANQPANRYQSIAS